MTNAHSAHNLLLRANKITKQFGGLTAVNEVSVDLLKGQFMQSLGPMARANRRWPICLRATCHSHPAM
jgi:ABC-type uncharacterized transport system ATPase subunit